MGQHRLKCACNDNCVLWCFHTAMVMECQVRIMPVCALCFLLTCMLFCWRLQRPWLFVQRCHGAVHERGRLWHRDHRVYMCDLGRHLLWGELLRRLAVCVGSRWQLAYALGAWHVCHVSRRQPAGSGANHVTSTPVCFLFVHPKTFT